MCVCFIFVFLEGVEGTRAFVCLGQTGSCAGGMIVPAHCANTDRQQVRKKKKRRNQKGTLAFGHVSLQHKAMALKHVESVTNPFQTETHAFEPTFGMLN